MNRALILFFNHTLTEDQEVHARQDLAVSSINEPPGAIRELWSNVPPELEDLGAYLDPVKRWLKSQGREGDYVLIQGDFGATYVMVRFALNLRLVPVYATTRRCAVEEIQEDGSVQLTHIFKHVRFRKYSVLGGYDSTMREDL